MFVSRIVCEMGRAEMSQYTGNVQVCVGQCTSEFMAKSSKYYYFVVSVNFCFCVIVCGVLKLKRVLLLAEGQLYCMCHPRHVSTLLVADQSSHLLC